MALIEIPKVSFRLFPYFRAMFFNADSDKLKELFFVHVEVILRKNLLPMARACIFYFTFFDLNRDFKRKLFSSFLRNFFFFSSDSDQLEKLFLAQFGCIHKKNQLWCEHACFEKKNKLATLTLIYISNVRF